MPATRTASQEIIETVGSWPGVHVELEGDLGETGFQVRDREIGHLHGDSAAHFSFPKRIWDDLMRQGRIVHHPVFPEAKQGPAARRIATADDVRDVIELLRIN